MSNQCQQCCKPKCKTKVGGPCHPFGTPLGAKLCHGHADEQPQLLGDSAAPYEDRDEQSQPSRSQLRREALQKGEPMPTFDDDKTCASAQGANDMSDHTGEMHTPDPRVQAYTAQSATGEAAGMRRYRIRAGEVIERDNFVESAIGPICFYADVDALLAARDAEITNLRDRIDRLQPLPRSAEHEIISGLRMEVDTLRPLAEIGRLAARAHRRSTSRLDLAAYDEMIVAIDAYVAANPATATEEGE